MQQYGPTLLTEKVALKNDLNRFIRCSSKLPDSSEVVDDAVMQLTEPQKSFVTTHFYKMKTPNWIDVTSSLGPVDRSAGGEFKYKYELASGTVEGYETIWATGYLALWWDQITENEEAGELIYDVVVRKPGSFPVDPNDGEVVVRAPLGTTYSISSPYRFDDSAYGTDSQEKNFYRLFHVFASGWWSYTDGTLVE